MKEWKYLPSDVMESLVEDISVEGRQHEVELAENIGFLVWNWLREDFSADEEALEVRNPLEQQIEGVEVVGQEDVVHEVVDAHAVQIHVENPHEETHQVVESLDSFKITKDTAKQTIKMKLSYPFQWV